MKFKTDPSKEAQKITFSTKLQKTNHNPVCFNQNSAQKVLSQKHLGIYPDTKLNFQEYLNNMLRRYT